LLNYFGDNGLLTLPQFLCFVQTSLSATATIIYLLYVYKKNLPYTFFILGHSSKGRPTSSSGKEALQGEQVKSLTAGMVISQSHHWLITSTAVEYI
jgi:hypothetical protein